MWKKLFYRFLDSYEENQETKERLNSIENEMFQHIKPKVEADLNQKWSGSKVQNSLADLKIADSIKSSFKSYEKQGVRPDGHFFEF